MCYFYITTIVDKDYILVSDMNEICNDNEIEDGRYVQFLADGSIYELIISTETISQTRRITIQDKSYEYILWYPGGTVVNWSSRIVGTFNWDGTYVWCTAGIAYSSFGTPGCSISYSKNKKSINEKTIERKLT